MSEKDQPLPLYCNVRPYAGTYIARGEKITASCTSGPEDAARAWAFKAFRRNGAEPKAIRIKPTALSNDLLHQFRCEVINHQGSPS
jgi:hypothetical protein